MAEVRGGEGGGFLPAAFLDRDGVINRDDGYVGRVSEFVLLPGVRAACRRIAAAGYQLVVVTNQGGLGLGRYSELDYAAVTGRMRALFGEAGVVFAGVYHCPFHPRAPERYAAWRGWRKPAPGMIAAAAAELRLDVARSFMVGDKATDMQAAREAGVGRGFLVGEGAVGEAFFAPDAVVCRSLPHVAALCGG